ncbi:DUF5050 domain-containing protein [Histomonas meleagridis]|uniref:DUF5050 domain-containing protein n=1 Tax=Histomonas meleagridis TaxID=135588 RepID=UPI00355A03A1|nr:DUF5050 domain-containing protein [Histomonas meleagridis]
MRTNETEERDVRKRVNEIFTTGNLTGYGRENDLHTDYEKSVAIWWWIKENVEYGFSKRMENSAYGGIILGKAVGHGYSAMSGILLQQAGVEVRCLMGLLAKKKRFHAWNWLHIGEEWFAYDNENEKENYKAQIVNASTLDKINEILLKAENKSKENENTQKTSAKDTIKKLPYLKSDSVKDFEEEINKAKDKESIKEVVTKAQSKNKELKVVFEKRETVKEEIKKLDKLGDMQKDYIEKLDKAHNEQEFDQILQDAKTKNEERQEEENAAQENKTNTIVMAVTVPASIIVVLVAGIILVLVIRKQRYQSVQISNEQSSKI